MNVILRQDVDGLGFEFEIVSVKPGYARNFLIPRGLASVATPKNVAEYLGLSRMTLYNYIATGVISCVDLPGRKLISRDELDTLFNKQQLRRWNHPVQRLSGRELCSP